MTDIPGTIQKGFIPRVISRDQARDTGMAMVLICLLMGVFSNRPGWNLAALSLLIINMVWPAAYRSLARVWLGLSLLMGTVVSKIILTILFFIVVTPVGCARRMIGADPLQLKKWKKDTGSVFRQRKHIFTAGDIKTPY
jgi:hypothetical protein